MKKKLKEESGISLLTLVITIVILMLLATMAVYSINRAIESSKLTAFTTELKIMQSQVDVLNEKMNNNGEITVDGVTYKGKGEEDSKGVQEIGKSISEEGLTEQANKALEAVGVTDNEEKEKYKYYDEKIIKEGLGVEGVGQELLINVENREVVSYKGIKNQGKMYYNLASLPGAMYKVEHEETQSKPDFDVSIEQTSGEGEWKVKITKIEYDGYINKWQVKYKLEGHTTWNTSDEYEFSVNKQGTYIIKLVNGDIESQELKCSTEYKIMPELLEGMQPVIVNENGELQRANSTSDQWYSYEITEDDEDMQDGGTTNGGSSRWANAELNGNYYVWIPRYAFKVDESVTYQNSNGTISNKIDVKFIGVGITRDNVEKEIGEGYQIPEAFTTEQKELSGFWAGKYEVSGTLEELKIVPDGESLLDVGETDLSEAIKQLETDKIATFITNQIEFEAIENLAKSPYGRNGTEITKDDKKEEEENPELNQEENEDLKTTTGNKYGIYNLFGDGYRITLLEKQ